MRGTDLTRNRIVIALTAERVQILPAELAQNKDAVITRISDVLAGFYQRPDADEWASRIRWRENFGTTGIGRHFALLHDFQHPKEVVATANPEADLWLFLVPVGVNWNALDEQSVHVIACPVFARGGNDNYLPVLAAVQKIWAKVPAEENFALAGMNAEDAAGWLNAIVARKVGL